jgi:transposase
LLHFERTDDHWKSGRTAEDFSRPRDVWTGARSVQSMLNDEIWKYDVGEEVWTGDDGDEM